MHISRTPSPFTLPDLTSLSRAILLFEPALDAALPPTRSSSPNYWCQSNRLSPSLTPLSLPESLAAINAVSSPRRVVELMNLFPASSAYGRARRAKRDFVRGKVYKWDLTGVLEGGRGDVEFRQAPGSVDAAEAARWVGLAVAFVAGAVRFGQGVASWAGGDADAEGASAGELRLLLEAGAESVGWEGLGGVEELFAGSYGGE